MPRGCDDPHASETPRVPAVNCHDGYGEVTWEAGVVRLQQLDGYCYVVEAIGDAVQINAVYFQDSAIHGEVAVAERGTVRISTSDGSIEIPGERDDEGTLIPSTSGPPPARAPCAWCSRPTPNGFESLAERVYG